MTKESLVRLERVAAPAPWEAYLLPAQELPIPEAEWPAARDLVGRLSAAAGRSRPLTFEVFLQANPLAQGGGARRLSSHAPQWMPQKGLGVWPDREPPRSRTKQDFLVGPGESPPTFSYQVFRITAEPPVPAEARDFMLGSGSVLQIATADSGEALLGKSRDVFLPTIQDPSYNSYPFYIPLLERKSLAQARGADLNAWFCGASLYVRESIEDRGLLIVSSEPLGPVWQELGVVVG